MRVIDCDAHVEETVESWQYLDPEHYLLRPIPVVFPEDTCFGTHNAAWVIDYKLRYFASNPTLMKRARDKGTDFPHGDAFRQDQLAQRLKKRGDLSDAVIEKI